MMSVSGLYDMWGRNLKKFKANADSQHLAIWDNRSVFHSATFDFEGLGDRYGHRVVGVGEKPYLDPLSTSRRTALLEMAQNADLE